MWPTLPDPSIKYTSFTHGVFYATHMLQDVLLRPSGLASRTVGGSIDLYFYSWTEGGRCGSRSYQRSTVGLSCHAHGKRSRSLHRLIVHHQLTDPIEVDFRISPMLLGIPELIELQDVLDNFEKSGYTTGDDLECVTHLPCLHKTGPNKESLPKADIDYMNQYRDFENDAKRFNYTDGAKFLSKLHAKNQHYVPIVDSAIHAPNPEDAGDATRPSTGDSRPMHLC